MAERFRLLMKISEAQYIAGSPLLLEACALYQDTVTNQCVAQLKWKNLDQRPVIAAMIELKGYDAFHQELETVKFLYNNLMVARGESFGTKTPVQIHDATMVRYEVILKAVSFAVGSVWQSQGTASFAKLPDTLPQTLEGDMLAQYQRDLMKAGHIDAAAYTPQKAMGLWQCGCGSWQSEGTPCLACGATPEILREASDTHQLTRHLQAYEEEQERLKLAAAQKAEAARIARQKADEEKKLPRKRQQQPEKSGIGF